MNTPSVGKFIAKQTAIMLYGITIIINFMLNTADSTLYLPTLITIDKLFNMGQNLKNHIFAPKI